MYPWRPAGSNGWKGGVTRESESEISVLFARRDDDDDDV